MTSMCPECNRAVAETCSRPLVRDDPLRCARLAGWLHGLWWSTLALGISITLVVLGATLLGGLGLDRGISGGGVIAIASAALIAVSVTAIGVFWTVAQASIEASRARAATIATMSILLGLIGLLIASESRWLVRSSDFESIGKLALLPLSLCSFAMFHFGGRALAWIAARTDRFVLRPQTNRFAFLTTLWHGIVLAVAAPLSLLLMISGVDNNNESLMLPLVVAWGFSWFGHAGWMIYAMVAIARVRSAVCADSRACKRDRAAQHDVTKAGAPA